MSLDEYSNMDPATSDALNELAIEEYAAVVAQIQSENITITPEMQRMADQIRGMATEDASVTNPLTEVQAQMMDKLRAEIKASQ